MTTTRFLGSAVALALVTWALQAGAEAPPTSPPLVTQARRQIGVTRSYDPAYRKLDYPGGDVPLETGVCSDVVVRAFRGLKLDLQKEIHEDMERAFDQYPNQWNLKKPDPNIDHRRVPNLMRYFQRRGWSVTVAQKAADYEPGDVVAWNLGGGITHIGILSDHQNPSGAPLVIHNLGCGAREEDILFSHKILGHYRPRLPLPRASTTGRTPAARSR